MDMKTHMVEGESSPKEYFKFALVLGGITFLALLIYDISGSNNLYDLSRWFMGIFFVVFAGFKFVGYQMFSEMFAGYDIIAKKVKAYAYAYPFVELGLGILYIFNVIPTARDLLTILILGVGTVGVYQEIKKRSGVHCACLGNVIKLPLSTVSLIEDVGMGVMAIFMLFNR